MPEALGRLDKRELIMTEIMPPEAVNFSGHVHGGYLMMLLDRVAYSCSARYTGSYTVTLSVDQVLFKQPIFLGELVTFYACVNFVGRTSLEVGIKVVAENILTGVLRHTNTCYFTMVSMDEKGQPKKIEPLVLRHKIDEYRFEEAKFRRQTRFDLQAQHQAHKAEIRKKDK